MGKRKDCDRSDGWIDKLLGGRKTGNVIVDLKF